MLVRRTTPEPSAFITYTSPLGLSRELTKTIFFPSGDHDGSKSSAGVSVRRVFPPPTAFIVQMSEPAVAES